MSEGLEGILRLGIEFRAIDSQSDRQRCDRFSALRIQYRHRGVGAHGETAMMHCVQRKTARPIATRQRPMRGYGERLDIEGSQFIPVLDVHEHRSMFVNLGKLRLAGQWYGGDDCVGCSVQY